MFTEGYKIFCRTEEALRIVESISNEDPDQLLKWEVDYPENSQEFTPFLDTQIRIDEQGTLHHKFYRGGCHVRLCPPMSCPFWIL